MATELASPLSHPFGTVTPRPPHRRELTLLSNEEVVPSVYLLTFGLDPEDPLVFEPGQYVTFHLRRDGKSAPRSYSICSSADRHDRVALLIKKVPGGFASPYLCGLSPLLRPTLSALAPLGKFVLHDPGDRAVVLVATGVGLAPFLPMLEQLRRAGTARSVWLFHGSRFAADLVGRAELERLARDWTAFRYVPVLSRPPEDGSWAGAVGHVEEAVRARFPDLGAADVYLCGANRMVNQMRDLALALGAPKEHVHADRWGDHDE